METSKIQTPPKNKKKFVIFSVICYREKFKDNKSGLMIRSYNIYF